MVGVAPLPPVFPGTEEVDLNPQAAEIIRSLDLEPHPEGGYYREFHRSPLSVTPGDGRDARSAVTAIWFLLPGGAVSRWHRLRSEELWSHREGAPLELFQAPPDLSRFDRVLLDPRREAPISLHLVPSGWWQAARSTGEWTLVTCTVAPGFDFADFELLADRPELAAPFRRAHPEAGAHV
jgi:predicted cupin superfamily sugar epimerase